jgi:hypothetical protein
MRRDKVALESAVFDGMASSGWGEAPLELDWPCRWLHGRPLGWWRGGHNELLATLLHPATAVAGSVVVLGGAPFGFRYVRIYRPVAEKCW